MRTAQYTILSFALAVMLAGSVLGWEYEEHRALGDSVYAEVRRLTGVAVELPHNHSFGDLCGKLAADDMAGDRYHERGRSVLAQLEWLFFDSTDIQGCFVIPNWSPPKSDGVVARFLSHHVAALRMAKANADSLPNATVLPEEVLLAEAAAQGYLADAFAAGHILSYNDLPMSGLQRRNRIEAHGYHRDRGVYVINGEGEVWQTFGDGLLNWYPPTKRAVMEACRRSWHELLLVWYVSSGQEIPDSLNAWVGRTVPNRVPRRIVADWLSENSGHHLYTKHRLPSLMMIPMPVSATWSFRTDQVTENGDRLQVHYPQLKEDGLHDPDLTDIDTSFLYSKESVPDWMIPRPLVDGSQPASHLVDVDSDYASVRWVQERHAPPSYKGLLFTLGGQVTIDQANTRTGGTIGLGYGIWDDLLIIKSVSVGWTLMPSLHEPNHRLMLFSAGGSFDLPGDNWLQALRFETGLAVGLGKDFDDVGAMFALGFDTKVIPFKFTYAGLTLRLKYQWLGLNKPLSGPALELVFQ